MGVGRDGVESRDGVEVSLVGVGRDVGDALCGLFVSVLKSGLNLEL